MKTEEIEKWIDRLPQKKRRSFRIRNKKLVFVVFAIMIAFTLVATGALLSHFGTVETRINAKQSVLLDGKPVSDSGEITHEFDMIGGSPPECFKHTLLNQGSVEAPLLIETRIRNEDGGWIDSEGVYVNYYELSSKLFISAEVTDSAGTHVTTDYYDNNLLVEINHYENCDIEYVVTTPTALKDGSQDNFAITFDVDNNGYADFQVSFHSNKDNHHPGTYWGYRVVENEEWVWYGVPSWIKVSNVGRHVFTISFCSDELGGIGSVYKFGVSGSFADSDNQITPGDNVYFKYPLDFSWGTDWITSENYKWQRVGVPIGDQDADIELTLQSKEELILGLCYSLHFAIPEETYDISTYVKPNLN